MDEGEVDEVVKTLLDGVTTEGYTDHFHGKGQKAFAGNYLELWEKVWTCCQHKLDLMLALKAVCRPATIEGWALPQHVYVGALLALVPAIAGT